MEYFFIKNEGETFKLLGSLTSLEDKELFMYPSHDNLNHLKTFLYYFL